MRLVIIGAGNVATVMGRLAKNAGYEIVQVISRKMDTAQLLADELRCTATDNFEELDKTAGLYIVAMSDAVLNELRENINVGDKVIAHTAGSVSREVLKDVSVNYGVLYPLQSLRKENKGTQHVPLLIDGNNEFALQTISTFANSIGGPVIPADDNYRQRLHVAAVVTNNFVNHLYALTYEYCSKEGLDFKLLMPLIEETSSRLHEHFPADMQTGPAIRKDILTLDKQLRLLNAHPRLRNIYLKITDSIMNS